LRRKGKKQRRNKEKRMKKRGKKEKKMKRKMVNNQFQLYINKIGG